LEHVKETALTDDNTYDVIDGGQQAVSSLEEELASERDLRLRLLAEFDNYRRRTRQEHAVAEEKGKREILLALLDVMDDFDRALVQIDSTSDSVSEGVRIIRDRLNKVLRSNDVSAFESEGQPFDPEVHEAMTVIPTDDERESDIVYAEEQRGYFMNGKLLRPARVSVFKFRGVQ
jgi:molecular chaperone GrpE